MRAGEALPERGRRRRGPVVAFAAGLVPAVLLACNAIIGLHDPTERDGGAKEDSPAPEPTGSVPLADASAPPFDALVAPPDTGTPPGSGPPVVIIINASRIPGLLFCVGLGQDPGGSDTVVVGMPQPPFEGGLAWGTGGRGVDIPGLSTSRLTLFVIPASSVPAAATCPSLVGANGNGGTLAQGLGFGRIPIGELPLDAGPLFQPGSRTVLAIVGCGPGTDASAATCGVGYNGGNLNLGIGVAPNLMPPGVTSPLIAVTALEFAPGLDGCFGTPCARVVELGLEFLGPGDASGFYLPPAPATGPIGFTKLPLPTDPSSIFAYVRALEGDGGVAGEWTFSLLEVTADTLVNVSPPLSYFSSDNGYVFTIIGDPGVPEADASRIGAPGPSLRVLAFPWDIEAGTF